MIRAKDNDMCAGRIRGHDVTRMRYKGEDVWKKVVDKAISLLVSSRVNNTQCYPYNANATIYKNIDLSLYKGIQFDVYYATIGCSHEGGNANLLVVAFASGTTEVDILTNNTKNLNGNKGYISIASAYRGYSSANNNKEYRTSTYQKTLTFDFTESEGEVDLFVVGIGSGAPTPDYNWSLSNAILLAR